MEERLEQEKAPGKLAPILLAALVCGTPAMYLYCRNAYEVTFLSVLPVLAVSVILGLALLLTVRAVVKDWQFAGLLTAAAMALFLNFNLVVGLTDLLIANARVRVYYLAAAGIFLLLLFIILLIKKAGGCAVANRLLLIAVSVVLVINLVTGAPLALRRLRATAFSSTGASGERSDLPNFYYLLVDEYASFQEIEKYYDYDNSAFPDYLVERGFCVSDSSFNAFGSTLKSVGDNVNLAQVSTADMEVADSQELVNNGILYGVLEGLGYDLYQLGSLYPLPKLLEKASFTAASDAATMNGETAAEILIDNSMLMPLKSIRYWRTIGEEGDMALFNYLDDPSHYDVANNRAIFFYIC